ncbi:MAG: TonB-dependent receptor [Bacteroidales bacterium]
MRLAIREKYLSVRLINSIVICISLFLFLSDLNLEAQTFRQTFENTPLSEALKQVSKLLDIKVAFDSQKLSLVKINREVTGNSADEMISNLLLNSGFEYKYKYNRYLIVENGDTRNDFPPGACQIIGSITDKETGEQLPFASIILYNKNLLASASENGSFCIKNVTDNPIHLMVSYIGYKPLDTTLNWTEQSMNIDIRLLRKVHMLDTIVVKGTRMEMVDLRNDVDFATTIDAARLIDLPMLAETDIFRTLQLLPGVSYTENSSGLSIRGGSSDQNLVLFDGQTLYNLSHYYGVISALNPNVIKDLQIYKGGYDSRFGERVSGIVDITGKSGNQSEPEVYGDVNLLSGNLTAEIPVGKKVTVIGAVRRSYSDIYSTGFAKGLFERDMDWFKGDSSNIVIQTKPSFFFYDYNAKLTYKKSNLETFYVSLYGGKDYYRNSYSGTSHALKVDAIDNNTWSNYGISASWLKQWNESFFSNVQAGTSGYDNVSSNSTTIDGSNAPANNHSFLPDTVDTFNTSNRNRLKDIYLSARNTFAISNDNQLYFGLLIRENNIFYHKDAEQIYIYDNTDQTGWTNSVYLQDRITLSGKLTLKPGFRLSYYNGTDKFYFEPRFSANYKFSDNFSVRIATGRYYQFISQVLAQQETGYNKNFWVLADNSIHPAVTSNHIVTGFTFEKGKFLLDAEGYLKSFTGLQEYIFLSQYLKNSDFPHYFNNSPPPAPDVSRPSYYITGTGRAFGIDLMLRYKANNFTSWISYSYGRSFQKFADINFGSEIPGVNDLPFQLSWTNMLTAGKWNFGTVTQYTSGKPYIDFTKSNGVTLPIERVYKRLPDYFRSDFSVNYNISAKKVKLKTGVTLLNIFNTQNYFDISTRKFDFTNTSFSETTLIQSQSFSVNLFLHFLF